MCEVCNNCEFQNDFACDNPIVQELGDNDMAILVETLLAGKECMYFKVKIKIKKKAKFWR